MIMDTTDAPVQKLNLIDTLQKLCVAYNFEEEIEDALQKIYNDCDIDHYNDLHTVSVYFRLLRQQGIKVSCDVFEKFKDVDRKFKSSLINDVQGMLNLYEAAHFAIHGEDILDEALAFTATQLKSMASRVSPHLAEEINHTLKFPIHDTYDSYGTLEELTLFTEAIRRWDIGAIDTLPDYMKFIYKTLFDIFGAIEEDTTREGRPYSISYPEKLVGDIKLCPSHGVIPDMNKFSEI
ncbi:hypothetical protein Pint_04281 [Pistacia integerrima]|uniref:Uncharacterized protein n=1 Tax=Pistacia integerrima TaxID=434235 RepID=A0ACC0Z8G8_9ROSI|nr:hypothetical protein Pint_04281 [Pistacia integerrima]